jgi:HAD superfamily hydrolase (TIGR01549 family)
MGYDAVVLDNDGVLVGLSGARTLGRAIDRTYRSFGVETPTEADREALWVGTSEERVRRAAARHGVDPAALWRRRDRTVSAVERAAIRAGDKSLHADAAALADLDRPLGVVSNNVHQTVVYVVRRLGLADHVGSIRARPPSLDSLRHRKPNPHYLRRTLADLGVEDALFVGDSPSDLEAASRAGVDGAFLRRPEHEGRPDECTPTHTIESLADLAALVE